MKGRVLPKVVSKQGPQIQLFVDGYARRGPW
jgi:hypothetical protein